MNNAPFKTPYKQAFEGPTIKVVEKLVSIEKQLHFLEARVKELEEIFLEGITKGDAMSESLGSEDSSTEDSGCCESVLKKLKEEK